MEIAYNTINCHPEHLNFDTWGVFVRGCQGGLITENNFVGPFSDEQGEGHGLVIRNNNLSQMEIYRNNFTQTFATATQMEQFNTSTKLQCNTYEQGNTNDWLITSGVLNNQGLCNETQANPFSWANNYFHPCQTTESNLERQIKNLGEGFRYRSHPDNIPNPNCTSITVALEPCLPLGTEDNYSLFCESIVLPTIQSGTITTEIVVSEFIESWLNSNAEQRLADKNFVLNRLFLMDSINEVFEVLQFGYDSLDRKTLVEMHLGFDLISHARTEIDSLLFRYPSDSSWAVWASSYAVMREAGEDFFNLDELSLQTYFFQHLDSTQEGLVDAIYTLADDSVFTYLLERPERKPIFNIEDENNVNLLKLYPNPASNSINIEFLDAKGTLIVTDLLGQVKYTKNDFAHFEIISTENYTNGVYIAVVLDETRNRVSSRFIVLK